MKNVSFVIVVVVIMSVSAQAKPFPYSGGSGTSEDPYRIATAADLLELASNTDDYDANFIVTADIDLSTAGVFTTAVIAKDTGNSDWNFEGSIVTAKFDFLKCTFTVKLKDTDILVEPGDAEFRMAFGPFDESVEVVMP